MERSLFDLVNSYIVFPLTPCIPSLTLNVSYNPCLTFHYCLLISRPAATWQARRAGKFPLGIFLWLPRRDLADAYAGLDYDGKILFFIIVGFNRHWRALPSISFYSLSTLLRACVRPQGVPSGLPFGPAPAFFNKCQTWVIILFHPHLGFGSLPGE